SNCLAEEFGQFCVPCQLFGRKDCNGFSYCEITGNNNKICQCTAGYRDKSCDKECEIGFYGHGCSKKCSTHCEVGCCPKNGNCKLGKCKYPYTGVNCDDPPEIIFKEAPTIFDVGEESCQVKVDNFEYEKPSTYVVPEYYMLEYAKDTIQEVDDSRRSRAYQDWNIINKNMKMFNTTPISLKHLEPDTYYRVRATFQEDTNVNRNSYLKSRRFRTGCTYMTEQDISSTTTNITATVTIKWPVNGCKLSRYTYSWNGSIYAPLPEHTINRTWLEAYTNYTIAIRNSLTNRTISKLFETKEGTPSKVRDIKIFSFTDQVNLSWQEPEFKRGNIIQYRIRHQYTGSSDSSCTPSYTEPFEENYAIKTSINIRDLKAYSRYSFRIQAITKGGEGAISTFTNRTLELGNLTEHEKTEIISVVPKGNNVRDQKQWIEAGNKTFQTEPSAPNKISELEAYSKDLKRISLRWKAPYPPTGILENYNILYKKNNYYGSEFDKNVKPKACKLWPDYHCASLTSDIWEGYIYEIQISAKNKVPEEYGSYSDSIIVKIKEEASKPPYGIRFEWTNNYDLVVFWNHPNVTNGPLTSFDILVQSTTDQKYNVENYPIHSQKDYYLTYNYTVPHSKFQSCTKYRVSLRAHNIFARSIDVQSFVTSPPDIPNTPELTLNATNETITIHFLNTGMYSKTANGKTYIFISKAGEDGDLKDFEKNVRDRKNHTLKNSRIVYHSNNSDLPPFFEIGNQNGSSLDNPPLDPGTNYSVSIFIVNECYDSVRLNQLKKFVGTLADMNKIDTGGDDAGDNEEFKGNGGDKGNNDNGGLWALILVLFIPLVVLGYWWKKKKDASANDLLIPRVASEGEEMPLPKLPSSSTKVNVVKPTVKPKKLSQVVQPLRTSHSKRIRITDFEKYVKDAIESGELERQHNLFPRGLVKPCEYGSLQENKAKNRYKNLIAYDETRVKLNKIRKEEYSDYINANFIDGYRKPRCYIATQGPKNNTLNDFWRMIWQERVKNIVMLANIFENGKKKVEKYWPDINDEIIFDDIRVQHVSTDVFANFEHRIFNVY
ncbi:Receptor-type tyrosine-protein phosphatase T, partial [Gonioctena quinquepunctata]